MRDFRFPLLWLAIGWCGVALLVYLSLASLSVHTGVTHGDKLMHLLAYALLMGWFAQLFCHRSLLLTYAVLLVLLGVALEFLQIRSGRYFELADMLANTLGALIGLASARWPVAGALLRIEKRVMG